MVVPPGGRPVRVRLRLPAWCAPAVRSDLGGRRGRVVGEEPDEEGVVLTAELPEAELFGYAPVLSRLTGATGTLERED